MDSKLPKWEGICDRSLEGTPSTCLCFGLVDVAQFLPPRCRCMMQIPPQSNAVLKQGWLLQLVWADVRRAHLKKGDIRDTGTGITMQWCSYIATLKSLKTLLNEMYTV